MKQQSTKPTKTTVFTDTQKAGLTDSKHSKRITFCEFVPQIVLVEGCHEPIIEKAVFDLVREKTKHRKRPDAWGNYSIFAGILKCGQCGKSMNIRRANTKTNERIYTCSKYNKFGVAHCSQHRIKYETLYDIVLEQIRSYAKKALADEQSAVEQLKQSCHADSENEREIILKAVAEDSERIKTLISMIMCSM